MRPSLVNAAAVDACGSRVGRETFAVDVVVVVMREMFRVSRYHCSGSVRCVTSPSEI